MSERYLNFFTDYGFKRLFGSEPTKVCLIDFLNSLFEGKEAPIVDLEYRNPDRLGPSEPDRRAIFDLYCTAEDGSRFIVELQKAKQQFFKDRALFYSTFPIQEQAQKGTWNFKLGHVYTVAILDFRFDDGTSVPGKYLYDVKLTEQETKKVFYEKLTFIYLEMPQFNKTRSELKTQQDKWLYAIKNLSDLQSIPEELKAEIFVRFFLAAEVAKLGPEDKVSYEQSLKYYRDMNNVIDTAFDEGKAEGKAEGLAEGEAKGKAEGMAEGKAKGLAEGEANAKRRLAKGMKERGLSLADIAEMTGMSMEAIKAL